MQEHGRDSSSGHAPATHYPRLTPPPLSPPQAKLELRTLQSMRWAPGTPLPDTVWEALVKEVKRVVR